MLRTLAPARRLPHLRTMASEAVSGGSLFSDDAQTDAYALYRPSYPAELYDVIEAWAGKDAGKELAVDIAAGSGQATKSLVGRYASVVAVDSSEAQVKRGNEGDSGVRFHVGTAESVPDIADGSVDLATCAQALHWFDLDAFYGEMSRLLKDGGVLAVWGYPLNRLGNDKADAILRDHHDNVMGPYWDDRRALVDSGYVGMEPSIFREMERRVLSMEKAMPFSAFMGYLTSWSSYVTYLKSDAAGKEEDPLDVIRPKLMEALGVEHGSDEVTAYWDIHLILARK
eukprot:PLAT1118.1.p1 GENE.PLAT1118.1~~PLAT1118.1.p1  ORF type:complete len:284 (+),score=82.15 PLAT1118.1:321-1172(+)